MPKTYVEWAERWLTLASFDGPSFDGCFADRNEQILELWCGSIPGDYERRGADKRVLGPGRYTRTHKHGKPRPGSEHEVEYQALQAPLKSCFGEKIVDGVNAPPLARDPDGRRRGNVEGDLLLLTQRDHDYRQYLLEVKVGANHAWYAVVENLRQLKLFQASDEAMSIMAKRENSLPSNTKPPVTAAVLAPREFYDKRDRRNNDTKKSNSTRYALELLAAVEKELTAGTRAELSVWDPATRRITPY